MQKGVEMQLLQVEVQLLQVEVQFSGAPMIQHINLIWGTKPRSQAQN